MSYFLTQIHSPQIHTHSILRSPFLFPLQSTETYWYPSPLYVWALNSDGVRLIFHIRAMHFSWVQASSTQSTRKPSNKNSWHLSKVFNSHLAAFVFCARYPSILDGLWLSCSVGWTTDTVEIPPKSLTYSLSVSNWSAFTPGFVSFAQSQCPPLSSSFSPPIHLQADYLLCSFVSEPISVCLSSTSPQSSYLHRNATADIWKAVARFPSSLFFVAFHPCLFPHTVSWMLNCPALPSSLSQLWPYGFFAIHHICAAETSTL